MCCYWSKGSVSHTHIFAGGAHEDRLCSVAKSRATPKSLPLRLCERFSCQRRLVESGVHGSKAKFRLVRGVACRAARREELADCANEFLEESSDHFGGHPKTAGRTFTGGAGRNVKAEGGDRKAAPLGIQIRRSRNAFRVPLLEFSFRVWKKRRVQAWRLGLLSGGKERAPRSSRVGRLQIPIRVHLLEFAVRSHSRGLPIPQWFRFVAPLHRGSPSLPPRLRASAPLREINSLFDPTASSWLGRGVLRARGLTRRAGR
jgi:hypothetical protein